MHVVNTSDMMGPGWRFIEPLCHAPGLSWQHVSGLPATALERRVRQPNLARWRAAMQACLAARRAPEASVIVTHLPNMAMAAGLLRQRVCPQVPQIAFAFNFTTLPDGLRHGMMRRAATKITEFVVFSRFERGLYARRFQLDERRLSFLPWAMEAPPCAPSPPAGLPREPYLCAIGGEARDYHTLCRAMARLPGLRMVIVGRPHSLRGIDVPPNVTVFTNLDLPVTWALARGSIGMALPLLTEETVCGHITIVGAQLLGIPLVVSRSLGVADYVTDGETARLVTPGDPTALAAALEALVDAPATARAMADRARAEAASRSDPAGWAAYFDELHQRHADGHLHRALAAP